MLKKSRGFTIVELLIVIAIIGILTTISVVSYSVIQANSRDSQRSSKITALAEALEKYYDQNGEYPSCAAMSATANTVASSTLKGIDPNVLSTPSASNGTNSILAACASLTAGADAIAYIGDSSAACTATDCLQYTLQYREESTGQIKSITSRRKTDVATSGIITNLSATPVSFTQVNINWGLVSNATDYTVQRATNSTFTAGLVETNSVNNSTSITGLTAGTLYYFRVTPNAITGVGSWSNTANATTLQLSTPVATAVANSFTQITLDWGDISMATSYTAQLSTSSSFTSPTIVTGITTSTKAFTGLTAGTTYYLRVQALATGDTSNWSNTVTISTPQLATPVATVTANSLTQITLDWGDIASATSYTAQMSTSSAFTTPTIVTGITTSTKAFTGLAAGTTYYFRVQALATGDTSNWSNTASVATLQLATPAVSAVTNSTTQITLSWAAISMSTSYTAQISTSSSFTSPTVISGITTTSYAFTGLAVGTTYYFRLQALAPADTSSWSNTANATTTISAPVSAPGLNVSIPGSTAVGTTIPTSCSAGTVEHQMQYNVNDGGWSAWTAWTTTAVPTLTVGANQGYKYGFAVHAHCHGNSIDSAVTASSISYIVYPIFQPSAPNYLGPNPFHSWWDENAVYSGNCPAGTWVVNGIFWDQSYNPDYWYGPHPWGYIGDPWVGPSYTVYLNYWSHYQCATNYTTSPVSPDRYNQVPLVCSTC